MRVLRCQHCKKRTAVRSLPSGVAFVACPSCGQQTPARPAVPADSAVSRQIENPAQYQD